MSILASGQYFGDVTARRDRAGVSVSRLEHTRGRRLPIHVHQRAYFSMTLAGGYREETGRRAIEYDTLTMVFHPPGTAHFDEIGPCGARFLMIEMEDNLVTGHDMPDKMASGYPIELPRNASWLALRLLKADEESTESIALELLGITSGAQPVRGGSPPWLSQVIDRVRDEFRSPPTTGELAARVGVHPVHLARVVRRDTGMSLSGIVRRRRIEHATRLMDGELSLASIALACGFSDQSHFTRTFRNETGLTPGEMRRLISRETGNLIS